MPGTSIVGHLLKARFPGDLGGGRQAAINYLQPGPIRRFFKGGNPVVDGRVVGSSSGGDVTSGAHPLAPRHGF